MKTILKALLISIITVATLYGFIVHPKFKMMSCIIETQQKTLNLEVLTGDRLRGQLLDMYEMNSVMEYYNEKAAKDAYEKITHLKKENKKLRDLVTRLSDMLEVESNCDPKTLKNTIEKELK